MSYLRNAYGRRRMYGENNESVYNKYGMSSRDEGTECGVVEKVKYGTLRWFGHRKSARK